jgi:hypothetical protein
MDVGFRVCSQGSRFRVRGVGVRVWGLGFRVQGSGSTVIHLGFGIKGLELGGIWVLGSSFRVQD